jgi:hypothetical protein
MNRLVNAEGGKFTVILFDFEAKDRTEYRRSLEAQRIAYVDCERPELHDQKLRQPDQHPTKALNELVAGWIEPVNRESPQAVSDQYPVVGMANRGGKKGPPRFPATTSHCCQNVSRCYSARSLLAAHRLAAAKSAQLCQIGR